VKIWQYLTKLYVDYVGLLFLAHPVGLCRKWQGRRWEERRKDGDSRDGKGGTGREES